MLPPPSDVGRRGLAFLVMTATAPFRLVSAPRPLGPKTGMASDASNGKRVLLVEDNEDNRIVYSTILRHFGYHVSEALNGEEGIAKARAERPDLILMDISIPIIDGWEATQVLKHDPATKNIPIIALTAHALASDREKAMEVGCDGYLAKPCEPRAVVAEVQRFLGRSDAA
jgi:CheY-like chemotaxis protein